MRGGRGAAAGGLTARRRPRPRPAPLQLLGFHLSRDEVTAILQEVDHDGSGENLVSWACGGVRAGPAGRPRVRGAARRRRPSPFSAFCGATTPELARTH
jgi:hypothetical protein